MNSLFDENDMRVEVPDAGASEMLLFITNYFNLLHFLSHRMVGPLELFGKNDNYYGDFLEVAPGRLPLFRPPVDRSIVSHVERGGRNVRPVLMEIDPGFVSGVVGPGLMAGEGDPVQRPASDSDLLVSAPASFIPMSAVRRLHFLNEEDWLEAKVRLGQFNNVPEPPENAVSVSPELVGPDEALSLETTLDWLRNLDAPSSPTQDEMNKIDRTAGAVMVAACDQPSLESDLIALLSGPQSTRLPDWFSVLRRDAHSSTPADPDMRVFAAAVSAIREVSPGESLRRRELLAEIRSRLDASGLDENRADMEKAFDKLEQLIKNEIEYERPRSGKYPALQGLMLFLIRRKPKDLLQWAAEESGASEIVRLTAAVYSGLLSGRARLPLSLRSDSFDKRVISAISDSLSQHRAEQESFASGDTPRDEIAKRRDEEGVAGILMQANLNKNGPYRDAAVHLCELMGKEWKGCVKTVLYSPDRDKATIEVTQKGGINDKYKMAWTFAGVGRVVHKLDTERFREKLEAEDVPAEVEKKILRSLDVQLLARRLQEEQTLTDVLNYIGK